MAETMVAVSMASVVALMGLPALSAYLTQYRVIAASNQVAFDIARARMQAVGQNVYVRVRFLSTTTYVRERSTDSGTTYSQDDAVSALPSGITATYNGNPTFNRNGLATAATSVTVSNGQVTKTIQTNLVGKVSVS